MTVRPASRARCSASHGRLIRHLPTAFHVKRSMQRAPGAPGLVGFDAARAFARLPVVAGPWDTAGRCFTSRRGRRRHAPVRRLVSRGSNAYMQLVLAAALAVVTALAEFTIVPYLKVGNAVL